MIEFTINMLLFIGNALIIGLHILYLSGNNAAAVGQRYDDMADTLEKCIFRTNQLHNNFDALFRLSSLCVQDTKEAKDKLVSSLDLIQAKAGRKKSDSKE